MAIVFVPDNINTNAHNYNIADALKNLIQNCENAPLDEALKYFEVRFPYKYKRMSNFRLVAKVEESNEYEVIYLLELLKKESKEWKEFNDNPQRFGQKYLEPLIDRENLDLFVTNKLYENFKKEEPKQQIPEGLSRWWLPFEHLPTDNLIMESEDWIRIFEEKHYLVFWQNYYDLIKAIINNSNGFEKGNLDGKEPIKYIYDGKGHYVYYAEFGALDVDIDFVSITYLIGAFYLQNTHITKESFENELFGRYGWLGDNQGDILESKDEIARYAKRGYPAYVLDDAMIWREIQENSETNLALSGEESRLLSKLRHAASGILPVFINGRAGSGKSTILYYLFSDYLFRKIKDELDGDLLFLTYSEPLLNITKRSVYKLIEARPDILMERITSNTFNKLHLSEYDSYFQPFIPYLLGISQAQSADQFNSDKYIDYKLFVQLFQGSNLNSTIDKHKLVLPQKSLTPEICWHVIRTFIKGYHTEKYLTPEEYEEIPNKEKSVSYETYRRVYETIWGKWYKLLHENHGFWDSQDLVRTIIQNKWIEPKYAVIFCDEAQDFTRIEIDLILKLLLYRSYDLGWDKNVRIPFALAGDPFQTLNPTGFRWEAIKASFYDEIAQNLDPLDRGIIEIQYEELFYNYRSEAPIVRFSNLLQLWRKLLFSTPEVEPQKPWLQDQYIIPPRLFIMGETISELQFIELIKNSVVIVPCNQNEEEEFIEKDTYFLKKAKDANNIFSVQSPILAKGQEFPQVILYRFGDLCSPNFFVMSENDERLSHEYFLNKLYVGATRASKSLIIVDTKEGKERLWNRSLNTLEIEQTLSKTPNPEKWRELTDSVTLGNYLPAEFEKQDPLRLADSLRRAGKENESSALLKQAMDFYRRLGKDDLAKTCQAEALEMDKRFEEAGNLFENIGTGQDAERCYWKGKLWSRLSIWYGSGGNGDELHKRITNLMVNKDKDDPAFDFLLYLLEAFQNGRKFMFSESQFQEAVKEAFTHILILSNTVESKRWDALADLLVYLVPLNMIIGQNTIGKIYYMAQRFSEAVYWWEKAENINTNQYYLAKAQSCNNSTERISWLEKAGESEKVVAEYEKNRDRILDREKKVVARAYEKLGNIKCATELYWSLGEYDAAVRLFKELLKKPGENLEENIEIGQDKYKSLISQGRLDLAYELFKTLIRVKNREEQIGLAILLLEGNMRFGKWEVAVSYSLDMNSKIDEKIIKPNVFPKIGKLSSNELCQLQAVVVKEFTHNPPETTLPEKQLLTKYFLDIAERGFENWSKKILVTELGSALERTGRLIDILPFYENLEKQNLAPKDRQFVRIRWLKTKLKQIERSKNEDINRKTKDKYETEFETKLKDYGIDRVSVERAPEFPSPDFSEIYPKNESMLNIHWLHPRCRISSKDGSDLTLDVHTGYIVPFGIDDWNSINEGDIVIFTVKTWGLEGKLKIGEFLEFTLDDKQYKYHY